MIITKIISIKNQYNWGHKLIVRRIRRHQLIFSRRDHFKASTTREKQVFTVSKTDNKGVVHKIYIPVYQEQTPINT